jgi:hypothetical protein
MACLWDNPQDWAHEMGHDLLLCFLARALDLEPSSGFWGGTFTLLLSVVGGSASDVDVL